MSRMKTIHKYSMGSLLFTLLQSTTFAHPNWQGFYLGASTGGELAEFNTKTTSQAGTTLSAIHSNAINRVGNQTLRPDGFLSGITTGYNWQINQYVIGIESDVQSLSLNETGNSGSILYPDSATDRFVLTTYSNQNWLFTARPRIGLITDKGLLYLTGGLAVTALQSDFIFSNNLGALESKQLNQLKTGYALGAGFETGLTQNISLKAEYLFASFGKINAYHMNNDINNHFFSNSVTLRENMLRLGLNYHFDNHHDALSPQILPLLLETDAWNVEIGARPFVSTGDIGSPQPLLSDSILLSRLNFKSLDAIALETYARLDHASGFFAKGYIGAGTISNGQLNDEDFPAGGAYSNTLSQASGNLSYATADVGYSPFHNASSNTGAFVGYNYYAQNVNAYNCRQLAGALTCVPSNELNQFLGISDEDNYKSMRVGLVTRMDISERLSLTSEAAFLPFMTYRGQDNHNARQLIGPESATGGNGSMLDATLTYQFADSWNVGLGARYWMWNMQSGQVGFDFLGDSDPTFIEAGRYTTYRYGAYLQLSYHEKPFDHFHLSTTSPNWRGLYIGGNVGGTWGYTDWSDPYGATPADPGLVNAAGFGDHINAYGPLGGIDAHYYWPINRIVLGIGSNFAVTDMHGQNTLFSGLGGVNGEANTRYFMTLVGKVGITYNQSLFYFNLGPAMLRTKYDVNANTSAMMLGSQSQTVTQWGGTAGIGIDYALNDKWTTNVEYDYIKIPHTSVAFPDIAIINTNSYALHQTMNLFKVGINYKLA